MKSILKEYIRKSITIIKEDVTNLELRTDKLSNVDLERIKIISEMDPREISSKKEGEKKDKYLKFFKDEFKVKSISDIRKFLNKSIKGKNIQEYFSEYLENIKLKKLIENGDDEDSVEKERLEKELASLQIKLSNTKADSAFGRTGRQNLNREINIVKNKLKDITGIIENKLRRLPRTVDLLKAEKLILAALNEFLPEDYIASEAEILQSKRERIEKFNRENKLDESITFGDLKIFFHITEDSSALAKTAMKILTKFSLGQIATGIKGLDDIGDTVETAIQNTAETITAEIGDDEERNESIIDKICTFTFETIKTGLNFFEKTVPEEIAWGMAGLSKHSARNSAMLTLPEVVENFIDEKVYKSFIKHIINNVIANKPNEETVDPNFYLIEFIKWVSQDSDPSVKGINFDYQFSD